MIMRWAYRPISFAGDCCSWFVNERVGSSCPRSVMINSRISPPGFATSSSAPGRGNRNTLVRGSGRSADQLLTALLSPSRVG